MSGPHSDDVYAEWPWLSIRWDRARKCVYAEFTGFANSEEFRTGTMRILDAIRDKHSRPLVSDNRRLEVVTDQDQLWIRDTWVPLAVAAGLQRIAVILARQGLGRIASEEILGRSVDREFVTRTFDLVPEALKWVAGD